MAEQNVVIKIQADVSKATNDVKALQQVIAKLSTSGTQAAAGTEKVGNAAKKTATASQLLDREIKKVIAGEASLDRIADLATQALKEQEVAARRLADVSSAVEGAVGRQGAAVLGANKQIGGLADASGSASFALLSLGQAFQDSAQFGMGFAQGFRAINNNIQQTFTALALGSVQAGGFTNLLKLMGGSLWGPGGLILGFSAVSAGIEFFTTRAQRAKDEADELKDSLDDLISITDLINNQGKVSVSIEQINSELARLNHLAAQARAPGSGGIVFDIVLGPGGQIMASRKTLAEVEAEIQELKKLLEEKNTGRGFLDFQSESERLSAISAGRIAELVEKNKELSDTLAILSGTQGQRIFDLRNEQSELEKQIELLEKIDALNRLPLMRLEMREQELIPLQTAISERMEEIQRSTTLVGRMQGAQGIGEGMIGELRTLPDAARVEMERLGEVIQDGNRNINTSFKGWWNNNKDAVARSAQLMQQSIGQIGTTFMQLAQTGDTQNKRLFETGKKFAIAQALISTYVGFTKAIEQGGPLGIITGASVLAAGMAKVAAIRATKMNGGGGGGGSSSARGISSAPSFFTSFGNISDFPASNVASLSAGGASGANISLVVQGRNLVGVIENEMQASSRRIGYSTGVFSGALASSSSTRDVFGGIK